MTQLFISSPTATSFVNMQKDFIPKGSISGASKRFYYATILVDKPMYTSHHEDSIFTALVLQVYCESPSSLFCFSMGLDSIFYPPVSNKPSWYSAHNHSAIDGNISAIHIKKGLGKISTNLSTFTNGRHTKLQVHSSKQNKINIITIEAIVSPWLRYKENSILYDVIFTNEGYWTGLGKTGNTLHTHSNNKNNKRISW